MADRDRLIEGYAQALFTIAEAEGDLEGVEDELFLFGHLMDSQGDLREALTDPGLPVERKKAVLQDLLSGKATEHTVNLLVFLVEQGRAKDLSKIVAALADVAAERHRKAVAEVHSAVPLDAARRDRLAEALSKATGKDIDLKVLVDPTVIGGIFASVGDQVFDGTIRRKLELARELLARPR